MRVSAKAEYACIAMLELAANHVEAQPVRIKSIADNHRISQRFLVQILLQLKGAGLVASTRGAGGGYQLTRPPDQISLANIINVIDRQPAAQNANASGHRSPAAQTLQAIWKEIQAEEQRMLEDLTLADLVRRTQHTGGLSYQI
jgi:Rrf2 family protein